MTERWRCFVAIPIPEVLRLRLADAVAGWRQRPDLAGMRWVDPSAWHVTLRFLGDVDAADVPRVVATATDVAGRHERFVLGTGGLGAFPRPARARVAWYGLRDVDGRLTALADDLEAGLGSRSDAGPFRPHLTLARARDEPVDLRGWVGDAGPSAPDGEMTVSELALLRSHLGRGPARYERLASVNLR